MNIVKWALTSSLGKENVIMTFFLLKIGLIKPSLFKILKGLYIYILIFLYKIANLLQTFILEKIILIRVNILYQEEKKNHGPMFSPLKNVGTCWVHPATLVHPAIR